MSPSFINTEQSDCVESVQQVRSEKLCDLKVRKDLVQNVAVVRDWSRVAYGLHDNTVYVWNVEKRKGLCALEEHEGWV